MDINVRRALAPVAVGAIALAAALAAVGTFGDDAQNTREYLVVCVIIVVAAAAVFGWLVPRGLDGKAAAGTALVLSALGLVSVAAFWSGLPPILAAGGALLGWALRERAAGKVAVALGVLALIGDVVIYATDLM